VVPAVERLGDPTPGEPALTAKLRGLLVQIAAISGGDAATAARCRAWFDAAAADPASVDPELVAAATAVVAGTGDVDDYDRMVASMRTAATPQEALRLLYALASFDDPDLVLRTCALAMSDEVKTQNAPFLLRSCIANRRHGPRAWEYVRSVWGEANDRFPSNTIVRMVDGVKMLNRRDQVADVQAFFAEHPIEQATKTLDQILERQRVNADLRERESDRLPAALL
jgi:puromycin-sensitive aminopeptidase